MCFNDVCPYHLRRQDYLCEQTLPRNAYLQSITITNLQLKFFCYLKKDQAVTLYTLTMHEKKKNEEKQVFLKFDKFLDVTEMSQLFFFNFICGPDAADVGDLM